MSIIGEIIKDFKTNKMLKEKYLNKSVCLNRGNVSINYYIHKVSNGYLYTYHKNMEIKFLPYELNLY